MIFKGPVFGGITTATLRRGDSPGLKITARSAAAGVTSVAVTHLGVISVRPEKAGAGWILFLATTAEAAFFLEPDWRLKNRGRGACWLGSASIWAHAAESSVGRRVAHAENPE